MLTQENVKKLLKQKLLKRMTVLESGCWEWLGSTVTGGYGNLTFKRQSMYAHRVSWICHNGDIPDNLFVLHRCDHRRCINPEHLFLGTQADNIHDMAAKGRDAFGHNRKLTDEQALQIKKLAAEGVYSQREIGEMFGVSRSAVLQIHLKRRWKHLWAQPL